MADRAVTQGPTQSQLAASTMVVGLLQLPQEAHVQPACQDNLAPGGLSGVQLEAAWVGEHG